MFKYGKQEKLPEASVVSREIEPNFDLLFKLLKFQAPSKTEAQDMFADWLTGLAKQYPNTTVVRDKYGNIYITKGQADLYPCVVAHIDRNQPFYEDLSILRTEKVIFGFDNATGRQAGIGADDCCGIYFGLEMLNRLDAVKVFFSKDEEVGCLGTRAADETWFKDCTMLVQLDRRSWTNDIIEHTNGIQVLSEEFKKAAKPVITKYGYRYEDGIYTDIGELKKKNIDCIALNCSCGYVNEHCEDEVILVNHFINAINLGYELITSFGATKWIHKSEDRFEHLKSKYLRPSRQEKKTQLNWDGMDWYDPIDSKPGKRGVTWHHSPVWTFKAEDEDYIQDLISVGQCPGCGSNNTLEMSEGETACESCEAVYNIPNSKSLDEVDEELWFLYNGDVR